MLRNTAHSPTSNIGIGANSHANSHDKEGMMLKAAIEEVEPNTGLAPVPGAVHSPVRPPARTSDDQEPPSQVRV